MSRCFQANRCTWPRLTTGPFGRFVRQARWQLPTWKSRVKRRGWGIHASGQMRMGVGDSCGTQMETASRFTMTNVKRSRLKVRICQPGNIMVIKPWGQIAGYESKSGRKLLLIYIGGIVRWWYSIKRGVDYFVEHVMIPWHEICFKGPESQSQDVVIPWHYSLHQKFGKKNCISFM